MIRVVYNACYGGYGLSMAACDWLEAHGLIVDLTPNPYDPKPSKKMSHFFRSYEYCAALSRHAPLLLKCIDAIGLKKASGEYARLEIAEVADLYYINEYDGFETVVTPENMEWVNPLKSP